MEKNIFNPSSLALKWISIGLSIAFFTFCCLPSYSQDSAIIASKKLVKAFMQKHHLPGLSISIAKKGKLVWSEGFGYADLEQRVQVDPAHTKFRIGSVSKTFTSTAIGLLYEAGKLNLEEPIQQYVPEFPKKKWDISLRQLAGHTAGIRHYRGEENWSNKYYPTVLGGLTIFREDSLLFKPGTDYSYSSYGWNLISAALETASGMDFLSYMQQNVFRPMGMINTVPEFMDSLIQNRTRYYIQNQQQQLLNAPTVDNSYKWAGGGFLSTTEDLILFGKAFLENTLLQPATKSLLWTPQQTTTSVSTDYGMGWRTYHFDGRDWIGHSGGSVGGTTIFVLYPPEELIVAITVNMTGVKYEDLHFKIGAHFLSD